MLAAGSVYAASKAWGHACQLAGSGPRSICPNNKPSFYGLPALKAHFS